MIGMDFMAWIQSHQEIGRHPKTKRAARLLGISIPTMIGHLHLFWHWCLDYAHEGALCGIDVIDLADAALWDSDPQSFVDALIEAGFLDQDATGCLHVHDWQEYGGKLIEQRRANADRQKHWREAHQKTSKKPGHNSDVTVTSHVSHAAREEKRRIEKKPPSGGGARAHTREAQTPPPPPPPPPEENVDQNSPVFEALCEVCGLVPRALPGRDREELAILLPALREMMSDADDEAVATAVRVRFAHWNRPTPPRLSQILVEWGRMQKIAEARKTGEVNHKPNGRDVINAVASDPKILELCRRLTDPDVV